MKRDKPPFVVRHSPWLIALIGVILTWGAFADLQWFKVLLPDPSTPTGPAGATQDDVERLRPSIFNVRAKKCNDQGTQVGTGFVVSPGRIATAAHVIGGGDLCGFSVVDYRGVEHSAELLASSSAPDIALLKIADSSAPPLPLADSTGYEDGSQVVKLVTIGYPLEGLVSSADHAAISSEGTIAHFDREKSVFVTSGLNVNPGNSGGPVFIRDDWTVLGIAVSKLDPNVGEGVAWAVPSNVLRSFYREKLNEDLP